MITKDDVLNNDYDFFAVIALIDKIAELEKERDELAAQNLLMQLMFSEDETSNSPHVPFLK